MNTLSLSPLFRRSIGFDRLNDLFETAMKSDAPSYPPYNVEKHGDNDYRIVVAASGFDESELEVNVENRLLTISGAKEQKEEASQVNYLHQGIAQRSFRLSFRLDEQIEVQGARFENGLLKVDLLRIVPEAQRPRQIAINGRTSQSLEHQGEAQRETSAASVA